MTEGPTCAACLPDQARKQIDDFVTAHFDRLKRIAAGLAKNRQRAEDLFSYMVDQVYSGRASVSLVAANGHDDMLAWCTQVMKTSIQSKTSGFREWGRKHPDRVGSEADTRSHSDTLDRSTYENDSGKPEEEFDLQPEIEDPPRSFREAELREQGMPQARIDRLLALEACRNMLPPHMSELFALYFEQGKSIRAVSALKGMPPTSVFGQVVLLRERIASCMSTKQRPLL